jgi:hypothetical protein
VSIAVKLVSLHKSRKDKAAINTLKRKLSWAVIFLAGF